MASSFQALMAVTGMDGLSLAHWSSTLLGLTTYLCGLAVVYLFGGAGAIRQSLPAIIIIGTVMAGTQYLLSVTGLWTLAGFVAGMAGILASILVTRMPAYRNSGTDDSGAAGPASRMGFATALSSYIFLIIIVTPSELYAPLHNWLNQVKLSLQFPEIITAYGWKVAAGSGKKISIFGHPGALLSYTAFISYIFYAAKGYYNAGSMKRIWTKTLKSGVSLSSAVGTLGAFMTGSNTNSNVIFGMFQKQTAELAGLSVAVILGAQTAGGSIGSMLAPAKILVGCSTVGLAGKEGPVLAITMKYGVIITAIIGLVALIVHLF
jgi:lactate permease